jgi:hypothetical protein
MIDNPGLWGIIVLIAVIYAVVNTVQSNTSDGKKVLWILLLVLLPVLGFILWLFLGPRKRTA